MSIEFRGEVNSDKLARVSALSSRVEIRSIRLVEATVRQAERVLADKPPDLIDLQAQTSQSMTAAPCEVRVMVFLTLRGMYDKAEDTDPPLLLKANFELKYRAASLEGVSAELLDAFGELNGVYNCWSYWREFVQSSMGRMGLPALTIPIFRPVAAPPPKPVEVKPPSRIEKALPQPVSEKKRLTIKKKTAPK